LTVFDQLADDLLKQETESSAMLPIAGIAFLIAFLNRENLQKQLMRELHDIDVLTRFIKVTKRKSLRLVPKGLVVHWIAGNIPLLGMFSWAISALLGNSNLVRISTRQGDFITPILLRLRVLGPAGAEMARKTIIVRFDRDLESAHQTISDQADVRIAWGGMESVNAIHSLPSRWQCEDVTFGPRMSMAVVDPNHLKKGMIGRLATDIVFFDQLACSSPQIIFVKKDNENKFDKLVRDLSQHLEQKVKAFPRHRLDTSETYQIHLDRVRAILNGGRLFHDEETQWTVIQIERPLTDVICGNRVIQVIPYANIDEIYEYIPSNIQTIITALDENDTQIFTEYAAYLGVCRFPRPGESNNFENPWDGIPLVSRLTKYVIRTDG
jgi:hypothetical protein